MASHQITWATKEREHRHITKIGGHTGSWTPEQVRAAIATGDVFYTKGSTTGKIALVETSTCSCGEEILRSASYAVADDNLDNLPGGP